MNKTLIFLSSFLFLCASAFGQQKAQRLLLGGSGWNKIAIIDKESKQIEWEHPLEDGWECNSVAATPNGQILFSYSKGAKLITPDHAEIWNIPAPAGCEMQTARMLENGNFLLAWCGTPASILEVDPQGKILNKVDIQTGIEQAHAQFRQVNINKQGNYLLPLLASSEVREISPAGKLLRTVKVEGNPFCVAPLENGNYLVSCGDSHAYLELNYATGKVVRKVNANDIEGAPLFFVAQLLPIPSGGTYICNWQGHDGKAATGNFPQLIELDRAGRMIWNLNDNKTFGRISAICPID